VWVPAGLGGHIDHLVARQASLAATKHGQRRYLYADLPYAGQPAWPPDITGDARDVAVDAVARLLRVPTPASMWQLTLAPIVGAFPEAACLLKLTPSQIRSKWRAVSRYRSQLSALRCGRRNALRRRRIFAYEACWLLSAES
jgi:hypothetical protein